MIDKVERTDEITISAPPEGTASVRELNDEMYNAVTFLQKYQYTGNVDWLIEAHICWCKAHFILKDLISESQNYD